jgi:hypothetical protein
VNWQVVQVDIFARSCPCLGSIVTLNEFYRLLESMSSLPKKITYASNDLMKMRRGIHSGIDQGIQSLNGELGAAKAKERICRRKQAQGRDERIPSHHGYEMLVRRV